MRDIQSPNPPFSAVQTMTANYMTTHISQYPMLVGKPEMVKKIAAMEKSITGLKVRYIPRAKVDNTTFMRKTVHDGDIIAIKGGTKKLQDFFTDCKVPQIYRDEMLLLAAGNRILWVLPSEHFPDEGNRRKGRFSADFRVDLSCDETIIVLEKKAFL